MSELIDRQAFIEQDRRLYCEDCDRRKGTKNGKPNVICYDIGEAPCRSCWLDDALTDLEDFPTASPWHRVEEELPKPSEYVLAWERQGFCVVDRYIDIKRWGNIYPLDAPARAAEGGRMKIGYKSWEEAKQAIRDKTDELLEIGKEPGVQRLRFEFDIDYELLPTVEYTVRRKLIKEEE